MDDPYDRRIARACGMTDEEARKCFQEAAENHERLIEDFEARQRRQRSTHDDDDHGETFKDMIQRKMDFS